MIARRRVNPGGLGSVDHLNRQGNRREVVAQRRLSGVMSNARSRPTAADDRDGVGVGDAAESGRSPQGHFGEPEPQDRLPVSGRSCAPAIDPLPPAADFSVNDRSTLELDLRSSRRESQRRLHRSFKCDPFTGVRPARSLTRPSVQYLVASIGSWLRAMLALLAPPGQAERRKSSSAGPSPRLAPATARSTMP